MKKFVMVLSVVMMVAGIFGGCGSSEEVVESSVSSGAEDNILGFVEDSEEDVVEDSIEELADESEADISEKKNVSSSESFWESVAVVSDYDLSETDDELLNQIPEIPYGTVKIGERSDADKIYFYIYDSTKDDYLDYIDRCQEAGFTNISTNSSTWFNAYNDNGYELSVEWWTYEADGIPYIDAYIKKPDNN